MLSHYVIARLMQPLGKILVFSRSNSVYVKTGAVVIWYILFLLLFPLFTKFTFVWSLKLDTGIAHESQNRKESFFHISSIRSPRRYMSGEFHNFQHFPQYSPRFQNSRRVLIVSIYSLTLMFSATFHVRQVVSVRP